MREGVKRKGSKNRECMRELKGEERKERDLDSKKEGGKGRLTEEEI